jgi:hypothetical protein
MDSRLMSGGLKGGDMTRKSNRNSLLCIHSLQTTVSLLCSLVQWVISSLEIKLQIIQWRASMMEEHFHNESNKNSTFPELVEKSCDTF